MALNPEVVIVIVYLRELQTLYDRGSPGETEYYVEKWTLGGWRSVGNGCYHGV